MTANRFEGNVFVMPLRVYYEDTDAAGMVYYANYLKFVERARTEMLRSVGIENSRLADEDGLAFAVRGCAVDYRRPARLDDLLEVRSELDDLGGASLEATQTVCRGGEDLVVVRIRVACIDLNRDGRAARIPRHIRDILSRYIKPKDQD
ncbi:MAG: tol-pal system-associated acyl-CoA thioesterase [Hyphomicrobiales bacterium]|nr:tol-pal system-associated acyl-CoA thioesterase [Hyphomicrobiales bacterium]MCP5371678.1 tol-pal system-associated acyl-CoA thioesterase [Hyphomicrobiales bacterium]